MIKELQSLLKFEEGSCKPDLTDISKYYLSPTSVPFKLACELPYLIFILNLYSCDRRHTSHSGKAAILIDCMVR